ncbi:MAG: shikimate kinase [Thaumarchaeota archaeon]|nr:shikimate kinase [Candidatus Calditenuaceae archaeon]MDW8187115.1 shikimate kinase [Nitrososphaerota archaeon]
MELLGEAIVGGAVTVVNAIPIGKGAALGVALRTSSKVRLTEGEGVVRFHGAEEVGDDRVVRATVETVLKWAGVRSLDCEVEVRSEIPVAVGLKSSSSAASAVAFALFDALGREPSPKEALELIVEASLRSGTSITGAADDASACLLGGFVVTDNTARTLLRREELRDDLVAILSVPRGKRTFTRDFKREALTPFREVFETAFELAERGDIFRAMTINGLAQSAALGFGTGLIADALRAGAYSCSISGTGPSIVALASRSDSVRVAEALSSYGELMVIEVNNEPVTYGNKRLRI